MTGSELIASTKLPELPSEVLKSHVEAFVDSEMIQVGLGTKTPTELKNDLLGLKRFIDASSGVTLRIAVSDLYFEVDAMKDEELLTKCKILIEFKEQQIFLKNLK